MENRIVSIRESNAEENTLSKQHRRQFYQVVPPNGPAVAAFGEVPFVPDIALFQGCYQLLVFLEKKVVFATGDPEEIQLFIGVCWNLH